MSRNTLSILAAALGAALLAPAPASAADLIYYLPPEKGVKPEQRVELKTLEDEPIWLAIEPVGRVSSDHVKEAVITRHEVEVLDEDDPVSELYFVTLRMDEAEEAKLAKTMSDLCKTRAGVYIASDGVVVDYRPFSICGAFKPEVSFESKAKAEEFAAKFSPKAIRFATPPAE